MSMLDNKRLGSTRYEGKGVLTSVLRWEAGVRSGTWPCVLVWVGYSECLKQYLNAAEEEWRARGKNTTSAYYAIFGSGNPPRPLGISDPTFISKMRSNLLAKDFDFYSKYGWTEVPGLPYYWPVSDKWEEIKNKAVSRHTPEGKKIISSIGVMYTDGFVYTRKV